MKKKFRRLTLSKETILRLQNDQLTRVGGQAPLRTPNDLTQNDATICPDTWGIACSDYPSQNRTDCTACPV